MARIVLQGTASRLRRLRAADLPADHDLSRSFLRWVDLSGFDLSAYDMEDMDIIDCRAQNVILPGKLDYLMSRRTDWTGCAIPADLPSYIHDLVVELFRQRAAQLTGLAQQVAQALATFTAGSYERSWRNGYDHVMTTFGLTAQETRDVAAQVLAPYPRMLARLDRHLVAGLISAIIPDQRRDLTAIKVIDQTGAERTLNISVVPLSLDRYQAEQNIRNVVVAGIGPLGDVKVLQLDPFPIVLVKDYTITPDLPDWWRGAWSG